MKPIAILILGLSGLLASCGTACRDLPLCLTDTPAQRQPVGGVLNREIVKLRPGETRNVTLVIDRNGIPASERLTLVPLSGSGDTALLARANGLTVTGSAAPFLGNQVTVTVSAAPDAARSSQSTTLLVGIRKEKSSGAAGTLSLDVVVD